MRKKNTAVVGAGWFGRAHVRNFHNLSNLRAVCELDKTKLDIIENLYDEVNLYSDIDEMIKEEDIEAVSVVTPPEFIPGIARKFASIWTFVGSFPWIFARDAHRI